MAYDAPLLGAVTRLFVDSILGWYQRYLRSSTRELAQSGAVVAVQRASSDLKLNPHLHAVFLDGVYVPGPDAAPEFRALPRLSTTDVADALPICGRGFNPGTSTCPEHGEELVPAPALAPARLQTMFITRTICPVCGTQYTSETRFCGECGAAVVPVN